MKQKIQKIALLLMLLSGLTRTASYACNPYEYDDIIYLDPADDTYDGGELDEVTVTGDGTSDLTVDVTGLDVTLDLDQSASLNDIVAALDAAELAASETNDDSGSTDNTSGITDLNDITTGSASGDDSQDMCTAFPYLCSGETTTSTTDEQPADNTTTNETVTYKEPGERTDCATQSAYNAANEKQIAMATQDIITEMDAIGILAQKQNIEYTMSISQQGSNTPYVCTNTSGQKIQPGTTAESNPVYDQYVVLINHSHPNLGSGYMYSLSARDILTAMKAYLYSKTQGGTGGFKALLATVYDGSQYMVYVNNPAALTAFLNSVDLNTLIDANGYFSILTSLGQDYDLAYKNLIPQGYSMTATNSYATQFALDDLNIGLKIYYKAPGASDFKEEETLLNNNGIFVPLICP